VTYSNEQRLLRELREQRLKISFWNGAEQVQRESRRGNVFCRAQPASEGRAGELEERRLLGLPALDPDEVAREFRLMTIQRGLKAIGTFSYQTAVCNRGSSYEHFIQPTLLIVLQAADWLDRFPALRRMLRARANGK